MGSCVFHLPHVIVIGRKILMYFLRSFIIIKCDSYFFITSRCHGNILSKTVFRMTCYMRWLRLIICCGKEICSLNSPILVKITTYLFVLNIRCISNYTPVCTDRGIITQSLSCCGNSFRVFQISSIYTEYRRKVKCFLRSIHLDLQTFVIRILWILHHCHMSGILSSGCIFCPGCSHWITLKVLDHRIFSGIRRRRRCCCLVRNEWNDFQLHTGLLTATVHSCCCDRSCSLFFGINLCAGTRPVRFRNESYAGFAGFPVKLFMSRFFRRSWSLESQFPSPHNRICTLWHLQRLFIFWIHLLLLSVYYLKYPVRTAPWSNSFGIDGYFLYRRSNLNLDRCFFLFILLGCYCDLSRTFALTSFYNTLWADTYNWFFTWLVRYFFARFFRGHRNI